MKATLAVGFVLSGIGGAVAVAEDKVLAPLAHFRFDGGATNEGSGQATFDLQNTGFEENALSLSGEYEFQAGGGERAVCATPRLEYNSFTVVVRLKPDGLDDAKRNLLTGGTSHRWFGLSRSGKGDLILTLNNQRFSHSIKGVNVADGEWVTIAASVDVPGRRVHVSVNGKPSDSIELPKGFQLDVVKDAETDDRFWTFTNYSNGTTFRGLVDQLMIFDRALSEKEMAEIPLAEGTDSESRAAHASLAGEWKNPMPKGGLTRLSIARTKDSWKIQGWGECNPDDCDWGVVDLQVFGTNPGDTEAIAGLARWDHRFAEILITVRLDQGKLLAESFRTFKDNSGRRDYHASAELTRQQSTAAPVKPSLVQNLLTNIDADNKREVYTQINGLKAMLDKADANANEIAGELLAVMPRFIDTDEARQMFTDLQAADKTITAGHFLLQAIQAVQAVKTHRRGSVVIGQIVMEDGKLDPELVLAQMPISSEGYFAGEVGSLKTNLFFSAHGYAPLDIPLNGKEGSVVSVGKITLKPISPSEQATLTGTVSLDGSQDASEAKVYLSMRVGRINTPHNGYSPRRRWPEPIDVAVGTDGKFTAAGLSPADYYLRITAKDHVDKSDRVSLTPGMTLDGGVYRLFHSDLGFYLMKSAPETPELTWEEDYDRALKRARQEQRPILVMMTATWCGPCKALEKETLNNPWIRSFLAPFVLVKAYEDRNVEQKYGLGGYPTLVFTDSEGVKKHETVGYKPPVEFAGQTARALKQLELALPDDLQTLIDKKIIAAK